MQMCDSLKIGYQISPLSLAEYTQLTHDHSTQATIPPSKQAVWNLAPELIKGINPRSLLPHLMKHRVIGEEQQEYITNPSHTTMDCNWCIVIKTYFSDPNHVIKFIDSLADEPSHPRHKELAKMLLVELRKELPYFDSSPCTMLSDHEAHGGQRPLTGSSMTIADSPSGDKEGVPLVLSEHPVFKTLGEASDQNLTSFQVGSCVQLCAVTHKHIHTHTRTRTHARTHAHTHTHTHTHT